MQLESGWTTMLSMWTSQTAKQEVYEILYLYKRNNFDKYIVSK